MRQPAPTETPFTPAPAAPPGGPRPAPARHSYATHFFARLSRYRSLLRRRWWILVLLTGLGLGAGFYQLRNAQPLFASLGRMIVAIKLEIPEGSVYTEELDYFYGTQSALMQSQVVKSRALARVAAEHPDLPPGETDLRVTVSPRTSIFILQAIGPHPEFTSRFLQACMDEYTAYRREMRQQTSDLTLAELNDEVRRLEQELRQCEDELATFRRNNSVVFLEKEAANAADRLTTLNNELAAFRSEYQLLQMLTFEHALNREGKDPLRLPGAAAAPDPTGNIQAVLEDRNPEYQKAKQQQLLLRAQLEELAGFYRPRHPAFTRLQAEIDRNERVLAIHREQNLEQLDDRKDALALRTQNLERDLAAWQETSLAISQKMAEYERLQAQHARAKTRYDGILAMMQTINVNKNIAQETVTIMEPASLAEPEQSGRTRTLAVAALLGLAAGLGILKLLDRLDDRMNSHTELQHYFEETILGQIPRLRIVAHRGESPLLKAKDPRHSFVEAYRNLRSSLHFMVEGGAPPRLILVTSSVPNDGKSLTATNLAITMAFAGARVLLIDADLRKGNLHSRFGLHSDVGFHEILNGKTAWENAIQATPFDNLALLPRGALTQSSSELFLKPGTRDLLRGLLNRYDQVIIDTAPVMAADDVTSLSPLTDGVLFVVRADHTSARVARAALDSLYQRKVRILGLVFNAVRTSAGEYYYYYRYRDYYSGQAAR